jgi:hypothetical protein
MNGSKGIRSIHTKVHNTASKAKNRHQMNSGLDLDDYEGEGHIPDLGNGLQGEIGAKSQRSRGSKGSKNGFNFGFGQRTDGKVRPSIGFNAFSSNKKAMIFSNPSEYFDNRLGEMVKEND